jgi:hypothetical protein
MSQTPPTSDVLDAAMQVINVLDSLAIPYVVGGAMASIVHGTVRATMDIDMVVDLTSDNVKPLIEGLRDAFYVDEAAVYRAIGQRSSFNLIHLDSMFKVDVFIPKIRSFDKQQLSRRIAIQLSPESETIIWVLSPEDIMLAKLERYRMGNETSEQQWLDILGVARNQQSRLDAGYLKDSAAALGVEDLLGEALADAGADN